MSRLIGALAHQDARTALQDALMCLLNADPTDPTTWGDAAPATWNHAMVLAPRDMPEYRAHYVQTLMPWIVELQARYEELHALRLPDDDIWDRMEAVADAICVDAGA